MRLWEAGGEAGEVEGRWGRLGEVGGERRGARRRLESGGGWGRLGGEWGGLGGLEEAGGTLGQASQTPIPTPVPTKGTAETRPHSCVLCAAAPCL